MPTIIKRYRNRKLYNTLTKRYVTLEEIEQLIKQHAEIKVIDNLTENDLTASTLSQIIFESEKNHSGLLPINLLISLVQSGGKHIDEVRRNIFNSLNLAHHFDVEIERRINLLVAKGELDQESASQLLRQMLSAGMEQNEFVENLESILLEILKTRQIPTKKDIYNLMNKVETLSRKVDGLTAESTKI